MNQTLPTYTVGLAKSNIWNLIKSRSKYWILSIGWDTVQISNCVLRNSVVWYLLSTKFVQTHITRSVSVEVEMYAFFSNGLCFSDKCPYRVQRNQSAFLEGGLIVFSSNCGTINRSLECAPNNWTGSAQPVQRHSAAFTHYSLMTTYSYTDLP